MALIVEDGTLVAGAESYASVAYADAYHVRYGNTTWAALTTEAKEIALRKATAYIDVYYSGRWLGDIVDSQQALAWPREGVETPNGHYVYADTIPAKLQDAVAVLALKASTESLMPDITNPGSLTSVHEKVGPLERRREYSGAGQSQLKFYREAHTLLSQFIRSGFHMERA